MTRSRALNLGGRRRSGAVDVSEHAMTEVRVMQLSRQGGLVMLLSTCCTDGHTC